MKTLLRTNKLVLPLAGVLGLAVIFVLTQCAVFTAGTGKVEMTKEMIVMQPAVDLSPADATAMDAILKKHSKALYLVDTVDNGKIVKTEGSLREEVLTAAVKAAIATESKRGHNIKIGQITCAPPCAPQVVHNPHRASAAEKQKLIAELKPILSKYQ
jgi:hypothetical protein